MVKVLTIVMFLWVGTRIFDWILYKQDKKVGLDHTILDVKTER